MGERETGSRLRKERGHLARIAATSRVSVMGGFISISRTHGVSICERSGSARMFFFSRGPLARGGYAGFRKALGLG